MGQVEVLAWLLERRNSGDVSYRSYSEIHQGMLRDGKSVGYRSVWWSITCLHDQGRIEARALGTVLSRRWVFRARKVVQGSDVKRVHNTYREVDGKSGRIVPRGEVLEAQHG